MEEEERILSEDILPKIKNFEKKLQEEFNMNSIKIMVKIPSNERLTGNPFSFAGSLGYKFSGNVIFKNNKKKLTQWANSRGWVDYNLMEENLDILKNSIKNSINFLVTNKYYPEAVYKYKWENKQRLYTQIGTKKVYFKEFQPI